MTDDERYKAIVGADNSQLFSVLVGRNAVEWMLEQIHEVVTAGGRRLPTDAIRQLCALLDTPTVLEVIKGRLISTALFTPTMSVGSADIEAARRERDTLSEKLTRRTNEVRALQADVSRLEALVASVRADAKAERESLRTKVYKVMDLLLGESKE